MNVQQYKSAIKALVDGTTNKNLLRLWLEHMEWDLAHEEEVNLISIRTPETSIAEHKAPYKHGNVFSIKNLVIIRN